MLFRSEEDVMSWCRERGAERGAILTPNETWALAQRWYDNRLEPAFHGRSIAEAEAVFASLGLGGPFWRFGGA
jgi:Alkylmercury lyase